MKVFSNLHNFAFNADSMPVLLHLSLEICAEELQINADCMIWSQLDALGLAAELRFSGSDQYFLSSFQR